MAANPTWTTALRHFAACACLLYLASAGASPQDETAADRAAPLRSIGARIKLATDRVEAGLPADSDEVARFARALADLQNASSGSESSDQRKLAAVQLLLSKLEFLVAYHPGAESSASLVALRAWATPSGTRSRPPVDIETVTSRHGGSCANALGISAALPVAFALGTPASGSRDAWFRFEPGAPGRYRFYTDSAGADPAIEIFRASCSSDSIAISVNDDSLGLDASALVAVEEREPLLVHVTNAGQGATTILGVESANGTISGVVTDSATGLPIAGATVKAFNDIGSYIQGATSDQSGNYSISIFPGSYYVRADGALYPAVVYPAVACPYPTFLFAVYNCNYAQGQLVAAPSGSIASGINFALSRGKRIAGAIRDTASAPVAATVVVYDGSGTVLAGVPTDGYGQYTVSPLPADTYKLSADADGHGSQMFNQIACGGTLQTQCNLALANSIIVANVDITGVNFSLPRLASIEGTISASGLPPIGYPNMVTVLDEFGNAVLQAYADPNGHYRAGPLDIGSYRLFASVNGYFLRLFDGIDCASNCTTNLGQATTVTINQNGQIAQADFQLTPLPTVHGHIQDAVSGLPLANVHVAASATPPINFYGVQSAVTDVNGDYIMKGPPGGSYYVWAQSDDHIDLVYPAIACEPYGTNYFQGAACDVSGATLLVIAPGQAPPPFDFSMQPSSNIEGTAIISAGAGSDLAASVAVTVFNGAGVGVASANTDSLGNYRISDIVPGTYYLQAGSANFGYTNVYITQDWDSIDCPTACSPLAGTPLPVAAGATASSIDFRMTRMDAIVGHVVDTDALPLAGVLIDLFDAVAGTYVGTSATDTLGFYSAPAPMGSAYFVATDTGGTYIDQVYAGITCPLGPAYLGRCPLAGATQVAVSYIGTQPNIVDFILKSNDPIFANGFE